MQYNKIITERTDIPIRQGDEIIRMTPAGVKEIWIVEDPGFHSGTGLLPSTYQMRVRRAPPTPTQETTYSKALRLLRAIYEQTLNKEEPVLVLDKMKDEIGLSEDEAKAAWRYLRDEQLIETFQINYTARVNANGINVIEDARSHPDKPAKHFSSVTYNYVTQNTTTVGTISNSPIQQGGAHSNMTQTVNYSREDLDDLRRLVDTFENHLDELVLDAVAKRKVTAQLVTIKAQLEDEPDPVIVRQAGRTLRNITEGAIGSLIAAAAQPIVWTWAAPIISKLFGP